MDRENETGLPNMFVMIYSLFRSGISKDLNSSSRKCSEAGAGRF